MTVHFKVSILVLLFLKSSLKTTEFRIHTAGLMCTEHMLLPGGIMKLLLK